MAIRPKPRLLTLPPSHFCERARWALTHSGLDFDEERLAPGLHILRVKQFSLEATSLPVLVHLDGLILQGSDRILDWTGLAGGDEAIERRFEETIGPLIRRYLYSGLLSDPHSGIRDILMRVTSRFQGMIGRVTWPLLRRAMISGMSARPELLPSLAGELETQLDWFDELLAGNGDYLVGEEFGRADLTAASLFAPMAMLTVEPILSISDGIAWPRSLSLQLEEWSNRPSIRWVHRIYERWRA
ncbi:glutathione S-transferase family protein [Croceibacterium aestuarii]|uniref:glutathione S-transferase family protein n=1 Tax=Croceibacterium aestuarii TaxID=3064139 RepID=UPI0034E208BC